MGQPQKKGLITRLLEGKEKSEEYARSTLPTNRWQLFWDIFKGNFGKIVKVNLLTLIFFIPLIAVIILGYLMNESNGVIYPFASNLAMGYPAAPGQQGLSEMLSLQTNFMLYAGIALASLVAAVGLAGGMYVIRNMVWTEGIFVTNDFWRGVKLNYKNALQSALFFTIVFALSKSLINVANLSLALGNLDKWQEVWMNISVYVSYILIIVSAFITFWTIALGVNYVQKFFVMLKNAALITLGSFPQTIFFGVIALLPFALFLIQGTFTLMLGLVFVVLFGFAFALLVWLDFAQWLFDKYINPKVEGAKVGRGIYNRDGSSQLTGDDSAASVEYQRMILAHGKSRLVARPIKPIDDSLQVYELPQAFTREDLKKLRESKQNIAEDSEAYAEEHKNDLRYVEYNRQFDERERALQEEANGKKKRAKKPPRILNDKEDK